MTNSWGFAAPGPSIGAWPVLSCAGYLQGSRVMPRALLFGMVRRMAYVSAIIGGIIFIIIVKVFFQREDGS
jgi:hypothetical protein